MLFRRKRQGVRMNIEVKAGRLVDQHAGALIAVVLEGESNLGVAAAEVDAALDGALSQLLEMGDIKGKRGEITMIHSFGKLRSPRIVVAGLGKRSALSKDV